MTRDPIFGLALVEQATDKMLENLFDRGVLGVVCTGLILLLILAGAVIKYQNKEISRLHTLRADGAIEDRERLIKALSASTEQNGRTADALSKLSGSLDARGNISEALNGHLDRVETNVQNSINNLGTIIKATLEWLEKCISRAQGNGEEYERRRARRISDDR